MARGKVPVAPPVRAGRLVDFQPDAHNVNTGTPRGQAMIEDSLRQSGAGRSLLADKHGRLVAGNKTQAAAVAAGMDEVILVPSDGTKLVVVQRTDLDLDTEEGRRLALADNRTQQVSYQEDTALLAQMIAAMPAVAEGLWNDAELRELLASVHGTGNACADADPQIDRAEELRKEWGVEPGQMWQLKEHTLMCGDATQAEDVARVMGGEQFALMVADPPYGISYADKNEFLNAMAKGNRIQKPIVGDHASPEAMFDLWCGAFSALRAHAAAGASYYVTGPQGGELLLLLLLALKESRFPLRHMLIWAKNNHVLGRADFNYQHEPILFGWVEGTHAFYGSASETSLWAIDRPHKSDLHPTMKPVELWARAMRNSTQAGDVVVDGFCGSGTSLIAAEQLGRRCRAIEIDPGYVAVALQRFLDATGTRPVLLASIA